MRTRIPKNGIKAKDLDKVFKELKKKTGKQPYLKGKGGGAVKIGFE